MQGGVKLCLGGLEGRLKVKQMKGCAVAIDKIYFRASK